MVGDGAWLGSRVTILGGVTVGAGAVIAAGPSWSSLIFTALLAWRVLPRFHAPIGGLTQWRSGRPSRLHPRPRRAGRGHGRHLCWSSLGSGSLALAVLAYGLSRLFAVT
jgi:hypothetical protein